MSLHVCTRPFKVIFRINEGLCTRSCFKYEKQWPVTCFAEILALTKPEKMQFVSLSIALSHSFCCCSFHLSLLQSHFSTTATLETEKSPNWDENMGRCRKAGVVRRWLLVVVRLHYYFFYKRE